MKKHYIYLTTNLVNNKKYIGKHYGELNDEYIGSGLILQRAVEKYGKQNFVKQILYISSNNEENNLKEKEYIKKYNATQSKQFYNIAQGGDGGNLIAGYTPEQRLALSQKLSKINSGQSNPMYGRHHTEETKEKIRQIDKSYTQTEQYRKNMSQLKSGEKNGMFGKHHTEESKLKMSINSKGKTAGQKNGMFGKKGQNAINGKKIDMCDKNGNVIQTFNAKTAVLDFLHLKGHVSLDKAIKNGTEYKGYFWKLH